MLDLLRSLFSSAPRAPRLDWVQVELSTACNASCAYCARTALKHRWQSRFMELDLFRELAPQLARTGFIHLQGWGESLLHPQFFDILSLAKSTGRPVSMTSNGVLITPTAAERLVAHGLDVLALSVAGASETSQQRWRAGASLDAVRQAVANIREAAETLGLDPPRLHLACMVLAEHLRPPRNDEIDELEGLTDLALELGVDLAVLNGLSLVLDPALLPAANLCPDRQAFDTAHDRVVRMRERAYAKGVTTRGNLETAFTEKPRCTENVDRAVVVTVEGLVTPCVFSSLPVWNGDDGSNGDGEKRELPQMLGFSSRAPLPRMVFGDLNSTPLAEVLVSPARREFLRNFGRGRVSVSCAACRKRFADRFLTQDEIDLSQARNRQDLVARDIARRKAQRQ